MTVTEPGPKRLSGEGDGRDGGTVKYVVRAKALDDTGKPTPFSILDPTTVLRCSLRLGDSHSVHSNGCLHGLGRRKNAGADGGDDLQNNINNSNESGNGLSLYCENGVMGQYVMKGNGDSEFSDGGSSETSARPQKQGTSNKSSNPMVKKSFEHSGSTTPLKDAKTEVYQASLDPDDLDTDPNEEFFWCSDLLRRKCMKKEHRRPKGSSAMRVDGSVRIWTVCPVHSCARWKFASSTTMEIHPNTGEPVAKEPEAMLLSIEYDLDLRHVPVHESARVDLPLHLYGALAACSQDSMNYLIDKVNLTRIVQVALMETNDGILEAEGSVRHRAALYALGHIGARDYGFQHLNDHVDSEIVPKLVALAEGCTTLSLRGAYAAVLGMLSRCGSGTYALVCNGWSVPGPFGANGSEMEIFEERKNKVKNDDDDDDDDSGEPKTKKARVSFAE